ncbi:MAG: glycoside hydrolase family 88 protein [Geminicoccaceae bacterium]
MDSTIARIPDPATFGLWRYPQGLVLLGFWNAYQRTGDTRYRDYVKTWVDTYVDGGGNINGTLTWLDNYLPGRLLLRLYKDTGLAKYKLAADRIRARFNPGGQMRTSDGGLLHAQNTSSLGQLWADGTFMMLPFLVEYGQQFGDAGANDEAADQLLIYASHLRNPATGLIYHAYDEQGDVPWADPVLHRSPEVWCRATGWYGMALVTVLDALPADHPKRADLLGVLSGFVAALAQHQDPATGLWYQVVDKETATGNWVETSCSAMHAFTVSRSVQQGYVDRGYSDVASRAFQGVLGKISLDTYGLTVLKGTSVGTMVGDLAYYLARGRPLNDRHGLGAFLIMYDQMGRPPSDSTQIWLEAEAAVRTGPLRLGSDSKASGGKYVDVTPGNNSTETVPTGGHAKWSFSVTAPGDYVVWGRVKAPTTADDSFWVRIDSGDWVAWDGIVPGSSWHWDDVHAGSSAAGTMRFSLAPGSHTLELAYREDGTRIDRLLITNATAYVPGGLGN